MVAVVGLLLLGALAFAIQRRRVTQSHAENAAPSSHTAEVKPAQVEVAIPQTPVPQPHSRVTEKPVTKPSTQPVPVIPHQDEPVIGQTEMVPGHFEGVKVSHVPLPEPPPDVPPGTPRNPPTVIHQSLEQGGGTVYLLDSTWAIPLKAPPANAPQKTDPPTR